MELHYLLFDFSGDRRHLAVASDMLRQLRSRVPPEGQAHLLNLKVYRAIDAAAS